MTRAGDQRRQAAQLLRLRAVRLTAAARALADAQAQHAAAQAAARAAADAAATAAAAQAEARDALGADLAEAERRLAVLDAALFRRSVADQAQDDADTARRAAEAQEAARRRAAIVARARHDLLAERTDALRRRDRGRRDERQQLDREDIRRFR